MYSFSFFSWNTVCHFKSFFSMIRDKKYFVGNLFPCYCLNPFLFLSVFFPSTFNFLKAVYYMSTFSVIIKTLFICEQRIPLCNMYIFLSCILPSSFNLFHEMKFLQTLGSFPFFKEIKIPVISTEMLKICFFESIFPCSNIFLHRL